MNGILLSVLVVIFLISMLIALGLLIYATLKFKKPYLLALLVTLVVWPVLGDGIKTIVGKEAVKMIGEQNSTVSVGSIITIASISVEFVQAMLVLTSAVLILKNETLTGEFTTPGRRSWSLSL